ncbi:MAG: 3-oxoacyl-ACP reductase FabG [Dehalococcoidales bacterium]|nr:3-oxoacyl-ACP reductase FabG [Dehalococcoidales bacterium]
MRLKDKVAIITGSARGLGKEFALRFVKEGAKVVVCDILDCEPVAAEIRAMGGEVLALKTDVTSEKDTAEMVRKTVEKFGRVDILVNNAAIYGEIEKRHFVRPFDEIEVDDWDKMMAVNLKGMFLCCKAVSPVLKKQREGKIVNIASTVAFAGPPLFLHYTTSKGGVVSMTKGLARALGQYNINVNAVAPGMTWTEATQSTFEKVAGETERISESQILKRRTTPQHISGAVVFLSSEDAEQITGQTLAVNAGEYI